MHTLKELYIHELKDLCDAEKQLVEALPKMRDAAESEELQEAFQNHLTETEEQLESMKALLKEYGETASRIKCKGMAGLLEEGDKAMEDAQSPVTDAALIAAAQRVEHYEMAGYGTARAFAEQLGEKKAVKILDEILEQESAANETLTGIATSGANEKAMSDEGSAPRKRATATSKR